MQNTEFTKYKEIMRACMAMKEEIYIDFIGPDFTARQMQTIKEIILAGGYEPTAYTLEAVVPAKREAARKLEVMIPQMNFWPRP